jgi:hypothetical protein
MRVWVRASAYACVHVCLCHINVHSHMYYVHMRTHTYKIDLAFGNDLILQTATSSF